MAGNPKLSGLAEPLRGQSFDLSEDEFVIGRTEDCAICIPDATISSRHCVLTRGPDGNFIAQDQGSTNGTRVNGVKITTEPQALVNSDILQVGGVEMLYDCEGARSDGATTTQTVIDLVETHTGDLPMGKMANLQPGFIKNKGERKSGKKALVLIWGGIGILVVAVLVALVMVLMRLFGS